MTTLRQAVQQALKALENLSNCHDGPHDSSGECPSCHERSYMPHAPDCEKQNAITALRDALAQQEQEPVAWMTHGDNTLPLFHKTLAAALGWGACPTPLYTHPSRREWQSLSEEEIRAAYGKDLKYRDGDYERFARAIEAALKDKNA